MAQNAESVEGISQYVDTIARVGWEFATHQEGEASHFAAEFGNHAFGSGWSNTW